MLRPRIQKGLLRSSFPSYELLGFLGEQTHLSEHAFCPLYFAELYADAVSYNVYYGFFFSFFAQ